jgi:hypothetical protein
MTTGVFQISRKHKMRGLGFFDSLAKNSKILHQTQLLGQVPLPLAGQANRQAISFDHFLVDIQKEFPYTHITKKQVPIKNHIL